MVAVGAAVSLLLAAACTGDDDSVDTSPAATPTTEATDETTETTAAAPETSAAPETTEPAGDFDPYAQTLEWSACEIGECAEATVPVDYDDPSAGTTTIAMVRQAAQGDPADRVGTLFVNPGGPGESGVEFVAQAGGFFGWPILEAFDIVGFDPRGVGQSDPLECLDDAGLDEYVAADVDPDDPASVEAYGELVTGMGDGCLTTNPELAQHVTTVETAKDIDVLRALVGDDELYYFGGSYGTFLGATYAALFPEHVGRMVLDGAMDPSLALIQNDLRQAGGFQLAFDDYAADCAANACELGGSVDEIEQTLGEVFDAAFAQPLPTGDPDRPLTRSLAMFGVIGALYDEASWPVLTEAIVAAVDGDGSVLLASSDIYWQRGPDGYASNLIQSNKAVTCLDAPLAPEAESVPTEDDFIAASPVFGEIYYGLVEVECDGWPVDPSVDFPDYTAPGAAPILVIGSTGDPATPIESARQLADELESGVLLVREGEGHTAYFSFNVCIDDIVDTYLAEGTVPEDGTTCSEDGELVDTSTDAVTTTTAPAETTPPTTSGEDPNGEGALGGDPVGTVILTVDGDDVFTGDITFCTLVEPDIAFTAESETAEMEVGTDADGVVFVIVTGVYEFEGEGTAVFDPDTVDIDRGNVIITGSGSQPDDSTPTVDFTVDARITSC